MATQTAEMSYMRGQADGRVRARSVHGFIEDARQYGFSWIAASEADALATMGGAERAETVTRLAQKDEEADFYDYVQEKQQTAGFPLYHHTEQERDAILLTRYFTLLATAEANLIAPWVLTLSAEYIAQVLIVSLADAQRIIDRADHLQNTILPEVQQDELWQQAARRSIDERGNL